MKTLRLGARQLTIGAAAVVFLVGAVRADSGAVASPAQPTRAPDVRLFGAEHVKQYEATGGKVGHDWNGTSCLILRTLGRTSGAMRKVPLIYGRSGNDYIVIASKGGAPRNPGWYDNLVKHPDVTIQVWDKIIPVRARTATPEEKKRLWPIMSKQWPGFDDYQAGTSRDIPLVILTPR